MDEEDEQLYRRPQLTLQVRDEEDTVKLHALEDNTSMEEEDEQLYRRPQMTLHARDE